VEADPPATVLFPEQAEINGHPKDTGRYRQTPIRHSYALAPTSKLLQRGYFRIILRGCLTDSAIRTCGRMTSVRRSEKRELARHVRSHTAATSFVLAAFSLSGE
jgi:hypothetical protein